MEIADDVALHLEMTIVEEIEGALHHAHHDQAGRKKLGEGNTANLLHRAPQGEGEDRRGGQRHHGRQQRSGEDIEASADFFM